MKYTVTEILDYLTPLVISAGDYARNIQSRVANQPCKEDQQTAFGQALTDADLSIQGFIEVALLGRFPEISFYGEEEASSLNMKYFKPDAELHVLLDPVDGTLFYRDHNDGWQVIVTVCTRHEVLGALCYMPLSRKLFRAEKGRGAQVFEPEAAISRGPGTSLILNTSGKVVVTFEFPELQGLLGSDFDVLDVKDRYDPKNPCINMSSILLGQCSGIIFKKAGLIDYGALAFFVCEAGGVLSDFAGRPLPLPELGSYPRYCFPVLCTNPVLHAKAIEGLKGWLGTT